MYYFHYHYRVGKAFDKPLGKQVYYKLLQSCSKSCNKCKLINETPENPEGIKDPEVPFQ